MFDETGSDYKPLATPKKALPEDMTPVPPARKTPPPQQIVPLARPLWLRLSAYLIGFMVTLRACGISSNDPVSILVQLASAVVLGIILIGLLGMRRWAAWMFIAFCAWSVISAVVVSIARSTYVYDLITSVPDRQALIISLILNALFGIGMYGSLGLWFGFNLKYFIPLPLSPKYGNLPYVIMFGVLLLFTATQIAGAHDYIEFQKENMKDTQNLFRQLFGG